MSLSPPLPSTPDSGAALPDSGGASIGSLLRRRVPALATRFGWGLYTLLCFAVFLFLTFPVDILLQRMIISATREMPIRIRYAHGELTWRGAGVVRDVVIEPVDANLFALKLNRLTVQPSWFGLFFGRPWPLAFQTELYGGTIGGTIERGTEEVKAYLTVQRVNLSLLPVPAPDRPGGVKGFLTGSGEVNGNPSQIFSLKGALELSLVEGALQAGVLGKVPVPPMQSLQGTLRTVIRDGRLNIADFTLNGDGVEAHLQGSLTLSTPLSRSGLDLQLTTKTVGAPPPSLVALVALLPPSPNTPGERRATISGSFAAPVMR